MVSIHEKATILPLLVVSAAAFVSTMLRYSIMVLSQRFFERLYTLSMHCLVPVFLVNALSSFLDGLFYGCFASHFITSGYWYVILFAGFTGPLGTMSTCVSDTFVVFREGHKYLAVIYYGASFIFGVSLTALGYMIVMSFNGH